MKKTVITSRNGQVVIREEKRGCVWWLGTWVLILVIVGSIVVYPVLIIPTAIIVALMIVGYISSKRRKS